MKKLFSCVLAVALAVFVSCVKTSAYADVPSGSVLAAEVERAVSYGLMNGYSQDQFGYSDPMTRAQFVTVLDRMMKWTSASEDRLSVYIMSAMELPDSLSDTYYRAIAHAVLYNVVDSNVPFRPNDPITRSEIAEMLVRALGLKSAAAIAEKDANLPFTDVTDRQGYIAVAYETGMTKGMTATMFGSDLTATRAQAAALLVRTYEKIHTEPTFVHGFYAISSYSQLPLAQNMNVVSAGWSRMTWDGTSAALSVTSADQNEYYIPVGYEEVTQKVSSLHLNVFMSGQSLKEMLASDSGRTTAMQQIIQEVSATYDAVGRNPYDGVTIDFEGLRSADKENFTQFLTQLQASLERLGKKIYVCVSPVLPSGTYYDGYDYSAIGRLADRVILMAYDYAPLEMQRFIGTEYYKTASTAPIAQIYYALKKATDEIDASKVLLGFSVINTAWRIDDSGKLLSGTPIHPSNETVLKRLAQPNTEHGWSQEYQQSYAIYETEDGSRYFLWYQDEQSIQTALNTAHLFGVNGVSLWRLGNIPQYTDWNWNCLFAGA